MPIPSISTIFDLIKKGATVEYQEKIMELRQAAMELQEENLVLRNELLAMKEAAQALAKPTFPRCPKCGQPTWTVVRSEPDMAMRAVGMLRRTYECNACKFTEEHLESGKSK